MPLSTSAMINLTHLEKEKRSVTPCTSDYAATNGWLKKGHNILTLGTASTRKSIKTDH
jgi:hypothetical protein